MPERASNQPGPQHFCLILNNNSVNSSSCLQYTHQAWIDARPLIQDLPSLLKIIQTGSASRQVVPLRLLSGGLPVHGRRQTVCIFAILTLKYNAWHTHTHTHSKPAVPLYQRVATAFWSALNLNIAHKPPACFFPSHCNPSWNLKPFFQRLVTKRH